MKASLRNSLLTLVVILSFGVALSATRLRLPAFSRSLAAAQEQPAVPAQSEEAKNVDEVALPVLNLALEAKIQADKADYLPGEVVVFSGSGWEPGESVTITIHEEPALHADRKLSVIADELGRIFDSQFVPETHEVGVIFIVKARGLSSGGTASTMAAQAKPAANIDQCANGGVGGTPVQCAGAAWQNGNLGQSQAHYNEGETVPYRASFTSLAAGQTYTATIEYDTTQSGKHALDYLTTFNRTETTASPCVGIAGVPAGACSSPSTFPIPADPNVSAGNGFAGTQVPGNFTLYNGTISAASAYTLTGTYAGSSSTRITLTFSPTSAGTAVLAWGGHIATRVDWGQGLSAVAISGSPFHMRLVGFTCSNVANCGVGQQDRSLSSEAVVFPASITIIKDVANSNTDPTNFSFTTTGTQIAGFSLDDDADPALSNTQIFGSITDFASTRTVTETNPSPAYALTALTCSVVSQQSQPGTATASLATRTATFALKEAEAATCTFVNTLQNGTLRVIKSVTNDNGGTAAASAFTVHVKSGATDVSGSPQAGSATGTVYTLAPGSYTVSEDDPTSLGYTQGAFSGDCNASTGAVTVVAGAEKTCTVTNNDNAATLIVIKHVINDNGGTATAANFTLDSGGAGDSPDNFAGAEAPGTSVTLDAGSYNVTESGPSGYTASFSADCSGSIANGQTKTCTVTNDDQAATLIVIKHVVNDNGGTATAANFTLDSGGAGDSPDNFAGAEAPGTSVTLSAGSYNVTESGPSGYTASFSADCSGSIANGQTKTCTVTNDDQAATLIVIKHVINDNGGTATSANFSMTVTNAANPPSFPGAESPGTNVTVSAGSYTVSESGPGGYVASFSADCSGSIANGETKTCTVTNNDVGMSTEMSWTLHDKVSIPGIVAGGSNGALDNKARFDLYGPFADLASVVCVADPPTCSESVSVAGDGTASTATGCSVSETGFYAWKVHYSGNSLNTSRDTACGSEVTEIKETNTIPIPSP